MYSQQSFEAEKCHELETQNYQMVQAEFLLLGEQNQNYSLENYAPLSTDDLQMARQSPAWIHYIPE